MKLSFVSNLNSITTFDDIEINDFCIVTGLNGSGKTHLLLAIESGAVKVEGIPTSEIIYYNYNDFNLHYNNNSGQPNNSDVDIRQQRYSQKGQALSQRLNQERNALLTMYNVFPTSLLYILDTIEAHGLELELLNWSDSEIEQYKQLINTEEFRTNPYECVSRTSNPKFITIVQIFGGSLNLEFTSDIKTIHKLANKHKALKFIRHISFNSQHIDWAAHDINNYTELAKDNPSFNVWEHEMKGTFSRNFFNFCVSYQDFMQMSTGVTPIDFAQLKFDLQTLFVELETYLTQNMHPNSLKMLKGILGESSLLQPIVSESGFLDLTQIAQEEKQYQVLKNHNKYNRYLCLEEGENVSYVEEEEFVNIYGKSPVTHLNEVLSKYDCNGYEFRCNEIPKQYGIDTNQYPLEITLYNKRKNYPTTLNYLSSGEKTLLALTFYIFKLKYRQKMVSSLLLLDEVDSSLHPSMSKRLIEVLHGLFYEELGIKMIVSTHSPSTVAFAPENTLYIMKNTGANRLIESTKDSALKELTFGVPSFSINYENRRQVFVESKYDVQYYENLYRIFKKRLNPEISLNFIASGDIQKDPNGQPKSNCDQVVKITRLLRDSGNQFIWGIIDWDLNDKKPTCENVKVLGWQQRYNIENFLFDPLLIAVFLLLEKIKLPSDFGLKKDFKVHKILTFDKKEIQNIVDIMIGWLEFGADLKEQIIYTTVGGTELSLPRHFIEFQGHKLEERYIAVFPQLKGVKKGQESTLKNAIIIKVIEEYEELVPVELLEVLKSVQEI